MNLWIMRYEKIGFLWRFDFSVWSESEAAGAGSKKNQQGFQQMFKIPRNEMSTVDCLLVISSQQFQINSWINENVTLPS